MPAQGFVSFHLKEDLAKRVDKFVEMNLVGFSSRADVISAALRDFFAQHSESGDRIAEVYSMGVAMLILCADEKTLARARALASSGRLVEARDVLLAGTRVDQTRTTLRDIGDRAMMDSQRRDRRGE